ncbi:hypothetical protein EMCRGX_G025800 [Ephydatia muelleri]
MYEGSAYIFVGGLDFDLTEGDVLSVFSQYGEIININLVRNKKTGKGKGFCFIGYEDQRSTILAVDNLNGIKLCGRTLRVDHVKEYRRPKDEQGNDIVEKVKKWRHQRSVRRNMQRRGKRRIEEKKTTLLKKTRDL